uniref:Uncharacterized protein n=1 Tax=Triticum urartu TaxID=4572 RepID=A0A8R7PP56_TRIUA
MCQTKINYDFCKLHGFTYLPAPLMILIHLWKFESFLRMSGKMVQGLFG